MIPEPLHFINSFNSYLLPESFNQEKSKGVRFIIALFLSHVVRSQRQRREPKDLDIFLNWIPQSWVVKSSWIVLSVSVILAP